MLRNLVKLGFAALWGLATPVLPAGFAQVEQGTITGTVTDSSGGVMPNARVVITNVQTGVAKETLTNDEGYYRVPYLHPGKYTVTVDQQGFSPPTVSEVNLSVGVWALVNFFLKPDCVA